MVRFDYLKDNKTILSSDGKRPDIKLIKGFNEELLVALGKIGRLKGKALKDYLEITQGENSKFKTKN